LVVEEQGQLQDLLVVLVAQVLSLFVTKCIVVIETQSIGIIHTRQ
jgi:hypothetical protein